MIISPSLLGLLCLDLPVGQCTMYTLSMAHIFQVLLYSYVHQVHTDRGFTCGCFWFSGANANEYTVPSCKHCKLTYVNLENPPCSHFPRVSPCVFQISVSLRQGSLFVLDSWTISLADPGGKSLR